MPAACQCNLTAYGVLCTCNAACTGECGGKDACACNLTCYSGNTCQCDNMWYAPEVWMYY